MNRFKEVTITSDDMLKHVTPKIKPFKRIPDLGRHLHDWHFGDVIVLENPSDLLIKLEKNVEKLHVISVYRNIAKTDYPEISDENWYKGVLIKERKNIALKEDAKRLIRVIQKSVEASGEETCDCVGFDYVISFFAERFLYTIELSFKLQRIFVYKNCIPAYEGSLLESTERPFEELGSSGYVVES